MKKRKSEINSKNCQKQRDQELNKAISEIIKETKSGRKSKYLKYIEGCLNLNN